MVGAGCVNTLPQFRATCNDLSSHKQCKLYEHLFDSTYDAHDTLADVKALQKIVGKTLPGKEVFETHSKMNKSLPLQRKILKVGSP